MIQKYSVAFHTRINYFSDFSYQSGWSLIKWSFYIKSCHFRYFLTWDFGFLTFILLEKQVNNFLITNTILFKFVLEKNISLHWNMICFTTKFSSTQCDHRQTYEGTKKWYHAFLYEYEGDNHGLLKSMTFHLNTVYLKHFCEVYDIVYLYKFTPSDIIRKLHL